MSADLIATARRHRKSDLELALADALEAAEARGDTLARALTILVVWATGADVMIHGERGVGRYEEDPVIAEARAALAAVEPPVDFWRDRAVAAEAQRDTFAELLRGVLDATDQWTLGVNLWRAAVEQLEAKP